MRLTHNQVLRFCHASIETPGGFPLALANESANLIYSDVIAMLETILIELRRLQAAQSVVDTTKHGKKR